MLERVQRTIDEFHMLEQGDRIVVGVSGGADSVCLLMVLWELGKEKDIQLYGVHVNHLLRQEAQEEEDYVKELCDRLGIPFRSFRKDVAAYAKEMSCSLEEAGRHYRYQCFEQVCEEEHCQKIAVAHHQNDRAETLLFHLVRGTGMKGLGSIPAVRGNVIRPLLYVSREQIEAYLQEKQIHYYIDASNQSEAYSRNVIRNRVIPQLETLNDQAISHFAQIADQALEYWDYVEEQAKELEQAGVHHLEAGSEISADFLLPQPRLLQKHLLYRMLVQEAGKAKDLERHHVEQVLELLEKSVGKQIALPYGLQAKRSYQGIQIRKVVNEQNSFDKAQDKADKKQNIFDKEQNKVNLEPVPVAINDVTVIPGIGCWETHLHQWEEGMEISQKVYTKMLDYGKINGTLCIRHPLPGDYFIINKQGERKKLSRFFIDNKLPREERDSVLVLAAGSQVYWIVGMRMSEDVRIDEYTEKVLTIEFRCEKGEDNG